MHTNLPSFQRYQLAFTAHIRDPQHQPRPRGVPAQRMAVYKEIVFNNLFASVSACFPVAQSVIGKRVWLKLTRSFLRDYAANSPIFRQIPEEFLNFIANASPEIKQLLPPYFTDLCHYEWVELLVASMKTSVPETDEIDPTGDLLAYQPVFTPTMQLLTYGYAVHKISPRNKPKQKIDTQLLVYRNAQDQVKFVEINSVTFRLITLLLQGTHTCKQALTFIANELKQPQPESIIQFGLEILEDLRSQGVITGTRINKSNVERQG